MYLFFTGTIAGVGTRARPGIELWEKIREIGVREPFFLIEAFKRLLASLLSTGFIERF